MAIGVKNMKLSDFKLKMESILKYQIPKEYGNRCNRISRNVNSAEKEMEKHEVTSGIQTRKIKSTIMKYQRLSK